MRTIHVQHEDRAGMLTTMPTSPCSIVRSWSARATTAGADAYLTHFQDAVLPALRRVPGHGGALVMRRPRDHEVEITVLTLWASMAAIHEFAGPDATVAVVEPAARAVLHTFDERAEHFELALFAEP
jgi:heme-degrading monooxygenase HmoA